MTPDDLATAIFVGITLMLGLIACLFFEIEENG